MRQVANVLFDPPPSLRPAQGLFGPIDLRLLPQHVLDLSALPRLLDLLQDLLLLQPPQRHILRRRGSDLEPSAALQLLRHARRPDGIRVDLCLGGAIFFPGDYVAIVIDLDDGAVGQFRRRPLEPVGLLEMDLGARPGLGPDGFPQVVEGTLLDRVAAEEQGRGEEKDCSGKIIGKQLSCCRYLPSSRTWKFICSLNTFLEHCVRARVWVGWCLKLTY